MQSNFKAFQALHSESNTEISTLQCLKQAFLPCAAEKSISACGRETADIQRSLSLLKEEKKQRCVNLLHLFLLYKVTADMQTFQAIVSVSYCVSVRSSRALCVRCSRNMFFWREWSLTRQFSARRSDTGAWSITVNRPPLEAEKTQRRNETVEGKTGMRLKWWYKRETGRNMFVDSLFL